MGLKEQNNHPGHYILIFNIFVCQNGPLIFFKKIQLEREGIKYSNMTLNFEKKSSILSIKSLTYSCHFCWEMIDLCYYLLTEMTDETNF